jgi:hypothetical protein
MPADVVRPQHQRERTGPERQVQIADGEEPAKEPDQPRGRVLLDPDPFRLDCFDGWPPAEIVNGSCD